MDIKAVLARRKQLAEKRNRNTLVWRPPAGTSHVRILPYKKDLDNPIIELFWHWNIGKKSALCLYRNFGEEYCPICKFATELYKSDVEEDKEVAKSLFSKIRFYSPVLIRREEEDGPKYWGYSQGIYDTLIGALEDEGCGDFTDIDAGRDIVVTFKTPKETGTKFGKLTAKVSMTISELHDDPKIVERALNEQAEILEAVGGRKTAKELEEMLDEWGSESEAEDNQQADSSQTEMRVPHANDGETSNKNESDDKNELDDKSDEDLLSELDDILDE